MLKWIRSLLLLGVVAAVGCSKGQTGQQREVKSPAEEKVDMDLEKKAMRPAK
jgi:hypothetical protein